MANNAARIVAHTARMILAQRADQHGNARAEPHPRIAEYAKTVAKYREQWTGLAEDQKAEAIGEARRLDDLEDDVIDLAVEQLSLEG